MTTEKLIDNTLRSILWKIDFYDTTNSIALNNLIHNENEKKDNNYYYAKGTYMGYENAMRLIRDEILNMLEDK